jgi:outer membrane protein assembly factor BamB
LANGKVYFGSDDHKTYCLDAGTGEVVWTYTTGGEIMGAAPIVADGKVYIGSMDNTTYCLDANDGWMIWSYDTGMFVGTSPAIANGILYTASFERLYAFIGSPGMPAPTPRPSLLQLR